MGGLFSGDPGTVAREKLLTTSEGRVDDEDIEELLMVTGYNEKELLELYTRYQELDFHSRGKITNDEFMHLAEFRLNPFKNRLPKLLGLKSNEEVLQLKGIEVDHSTFPAASSSFWNFGDMTRQVDQTQRGGNALLNFGEVKEDDDEEDDEDESEEDSEDDFDSEDSQGQKKSAKNKKKGGDDHGKKTDQTLAVEKSNVKFSWMSQLNSKKRVDSAGDESHVDNSRRKKSANSSKLYNSILGSDLFGLKAKFGKFMKKPGTEVSTVDDPTAYIEFTDFVKLLKIFNPRGSQEEKLKFQFKIYDLDEDKKLGEEDLSTVLRMIVSEEQLSAVELKTVIDHVMSEADRSNKGYIDQEDFTRVLSSTDIGIKMSLYFST